MHCFFTRIAQVLSYHVHQIRPLLRKVLLCHLVQALHVELYDTQVILLLSCLQDVLLQILPVSLGNLQNFLF